eukprot:8836760-Alexandrium_andersonii.AAC.1
MLRSARQAQIKHLQTRGSRSEADVSSCSGVASCFSSAGIWSCMLGVIVVSDVLGVADAVALAV